MKCLIFIVSISLLTDIQSVGQTPSDSPEKSIKIVLRTHIVRGDSALAKGDLPYAEKEYKLSYGLIEKVLQQRKSHRIS